MPNLHGPPQPSVLYALFSERRGYFKSLTAANGYRLRTTAEDQLKRLPVKDKFRIVRMVPDELETIPSTNRRK